MRRVKALMIGRLSLTWLWPILCLLALPSAQAGAMRAANDAPAALVSSAASENHSAQDVGDIRYHSSRSTRRFVLQSSSDDTSPALHLFQVEVARGKNTSCSHVSSAAGLELASTWQFLWRTALSPRAPSFVS